MAKVKKSKKETNIQKRTNGSLKRFLGNFLGFFVTFVIFFSIYGYLTYGGIFSLPTFMNSYSVEFTPRIDVSTEAYDSAMAKLEAWKISNDEKMKTTMSLSEEELFSILKKVDNSLEVVNILDDRFILGKKMNFGNANWKLSIVLKIKRGHIPPFPDEIYIGKLKLPPPILHFIKTFTTMDVKIKTQLSSIFKKFGTDLRNIKVKLGDGELKFFN
jgi:hypothetical protein